MGRRARPWLVVTACSDYYGSERALLEILDALPDGAQDAIVCVPRDGLLARAVRERGLPVRLLGDSSQRVVRWSQRASAFLGLLGERPRAVYFNEGSMFRLAWLLATCTKVPVTVHVRTMSEVTLINETVRRLPWPRALRLIAISDFVVAQLRVPREAVDRLYDGFGQAELGENVLTGKERPLRACVLGRLVPQKRQEFVIRALAEHGAVLGDLDYSISFVGGDLDAPYARHLRQLVRELGLEARIVFVPFSADVASIYRAHHLVIIPSYQEALGRTWFEALRARVPVLVSSEGGPAELTGRHAIGTTYRVDDGLAFCEALRLAFERLAEQRALIDQQHEAVLAQYAMKDYVARLLKIVLR